MGGLLSKKLDELTIDTVHTPLSNKRVMELNIDPRSPGIMRTPILIERTPELLQDPRSPTPGIMRTPLVNSNDNPVSSQSSGLDISNISFSGSLTEFDPHTMQEALYTLPPLSLGDDDEAECSNEQEDVKSENTEAIKINSNECSVPQRRNVERESSESMPSLVINYKTKSTTFHIHSDKKEKQREFQRSPLCFVTDSHQRSPLSKRNIDVSSPHHLVQRKLVKRIGMLKSAATATMQKSAPNSPCKLDAMCHEDKENVSLI